jgi:hypothetical protein
MGHDLHSFLDLKINYLHPWMKDDDINVETIWEGKDMGLLCWDCLACFARRCYGVSFSDFFLIDPAPQYMGCLGTGLA